MDRHRPALTGWQAALLAAPSAGLPGALLPLARGQHPGTRPGAPRGAPARCGPRRLAAALRGRRGPLHARPGDRVHPAHAGAGPARGLGAGSLRVPRPSCAPGAHRGALRAPDRRRGLRLPGPARSPGPARRARGAGLRGRRAAGAPRWLRGRHRRGPCLLQRGRRRAAGGWHVGEPRPAPEEASRVLGALVHGLPSAR